MSNKQLLVRTVGTAAAVLLVAGAGAAPAIAGQGASHGDEHTAAQHREQRGHSAGHARSHSAGHRAADARSARADRAASPSSPAGPKADRGVDEPKGEQGLGNSRGNGHTPVTVCHLLGNGGYHLLTMDDNALQAHLGHGDVYPDADGTCPVPTADPADDDSVALPEDTVTSEGGTPAEESETPTQQLGAVGEEPVDQERAVVAGVEQFATTAAPSTGAGRVAGTEAASGANRAPALTGPLAGILPQTGAGQLALALVGGLVLLAGGAMTLLRGRFGSA